jgi:hypothetical protein
MPSSVPRLRVSARAHGAARRVAVLALAVPLTLMAACTVAPPPAPPPSADPAPPAGPGTPLRDHLAFGAYVPDLPAGRTGLPALEAKLGTKLEVASAFTDWDYVFGGANDRWMADNGTRKVVYSWEPFDLRFAQIAGGAKDAYLQRVADSMNAYPYTIYVRPWGEMNANWSSWQPTPGGEKRDGGTPAEFKAAWQHTVSFFRDRHVDNLKFVFNPDASDFPDNTRIPSIWPGAGYVDVLGIDGYNWGIEASSGNTWREFDAIFTKMYGILTGLHPTAPVWITEVGSKEPTKSDGAPIDAAHSKGQWFANMLSSTTFPRVEAMAYFSTQKERDWRIDSSDASLAALRSQLALRPGH